MPAVDKLLLARSTPAGFAWYTSGGYEDKATWLMPPHLRLLSEKIVAVATGRIPRLIVTMPPRHGKSELISKYTPAWYLGSHPDNKVMLASYADTFAATWGRKSRDLLEEYGPKVFGVGVNPDSKSGAHWEVGKKRGGRKADGVMVTAGVGGGLTGKGAHLLIIDDPVKNSEEAQSENTRQAHHDWWKSTARTRLQKGAGVILVMTRWHEDDLAGRLLQDELEGGDEWEVLNLPAICEVDNDPIGRAMGEALWPDMFDTDSLAQTKRAMGEYWFGAMYQQRPAPADGMLFKRQNFRYYEKHEGNLVTIHTDAGPRVFDIGYGTKFCTMDVAGSEKQQSDYTVIATWVVTENKELLLWNIDRAQYDGPDIVPFVKRVYYEQRPQVMGIERLGYGLPIIQELVREGFPIIRLEPVADKVARALPAAARYEEHRVFHPRGVQWIDAYESELLVFPNGRNDDQVDVTSYAAMQLPAHQPRHRGGRGQSQRNRGTMLVGNALAAQF